MRSAGDLCHSARVLITAVLSWSLLMTLVAYFFVGFSRCAERSAHASDDQDSPLPEPYPTADTMP